MPLAYTFSLLICPAIHYFLWLCPLSFLLCTSCWWLWQCSVSYRTVVLSCIYISHFLSGCFNFDC